MDIQNAIVKYGDAYKTVFRDGIVIWRPLTKKEFDDVKNLADNNVLSIIEQEDYVYNLCNVYSSYDETTLRAGIVSTISYQLFYFTGFETGEDVVKGNLNKARESVNNNPFDQAIILICKAFPSYTPDMLEGKTLYELLRLVALGEQASGLVFLYGDSEEIEKQKAVLNKGAPPQTQHVNKRIRGQGGVDSTPYDNAINSVNPNIGGMNAETIRHIPLLTKKDILQTRSHVNTTKENARMVADGFPFTDAFKQELDAKRYGWS